MEFLNIGNAKDLDWCGFVLDWLLDGVKIFNKAKHSDGGALPGCLYYLAVLYLDYVDFGARQVPLSVPRISVWKGSMIRDYADFDSKSPGCYGYHPLLDISRTCFSKDLRFIGNPASLSFGDDFKEKLDTFAGCTLPEILKMDICKLIQNHCFNSGLSINLDVHSVNALPDNLKSCFCKLLTHAYSIDSRSQQLVLDLMKLVVDTIATGDENIKEDSSQHVNAATQLQNSPNVKYLDATDHVHCSQQHTSNEYDNSSSVATTRAGQVIT